MDYGLGMSHTAAILAGSGLIPDCEITWPRNATWHATILHLDNFTRRLCSQYNHF